MTLLEWIEKYEKKAEPWDLQPGYSILYRSDKGFFNWRANGLAFDIDHTSTNDIKWMMDKASELAREHGCKFLRALTLHDPAAFMRLTGARLNMPLSGVRQNGTFYWCFEKEV